MSSTAVAPAAARRRPGGLASDPRLAAVEWRIPDENAARRRSAVLAVLCALLAAWYLSWLLQGERVGEEPLFGILQKKVDEKGDSGLQMPVFTDVAIKVGLARISEWAFRNVPNETTMYSSLFYWLKAKYPNAQSVYGGVEEDFAHSRASWYAVMKDRAEANGYKVLGNSKWLVADTNFATQVREMKNANADIVAIAAHPFTTCGVLKMKLAIA